MTSWSNSKIATSRESLASAITKTSKEMTEKKDCTKKEIARKNLIYKEETWQSI